MNPSRYCSESTTKSPNPSRSSRYYIVHTPKIKAKNKHGITSDICISVVPQSTYLDGFAFIFGVAGINNLDEPRQPRRARQTPIQQWAMLGVELYTKNEGEHMETLR